MKEGDINEKIIIQYALRSIRLSVCICVTIQKKIESDGRREEKSKDIREGKSKKKRRKGARKGERE